MAAPPITQTPQPDLYTSDPSSSGLAQENISDIQFPTGESSADHVTLRIDFKWGKFKSLISDVQNSDKPLYKIKYKIFSQKQLVYMDATTDNVLGTGAIHMINIDADYECRGRRDTLVAQKRFKTSYTHRSGVLKRSDGSPAVLNWTGDFGLITWNFVCVDEQQQPVAKFTANLWGIKKLGKIELMGPSARDEALRDEMVITGMTLAYCMITRANNIFSLVGAIFGDPGHDKKYNSDPARLKESMHSSSDSLPDESAAKKAALKK